MTDEPIRNDEECLVALWTCGAACRDCEDTDCRYAGQERTLDLQNTSDDDNVDNGTYEQGKLL